MSAAAATPLRYIGFRSRYLDVAVRGEEFLGLAVEYAAHPSNVGCFIVRFVVHGKGIDAKNYKHLTYREKAQFLVPSSKTNPHSEMFNGYRLNKVAIQAFQPAVQPYEVPSFAEKLGTFPLLAAWVSEQIVKEGFTVTVDLEQEIRNFMTVAFPVTTDEVASVFTAPDLSAPAQQQAAAAQAQKPTDDVDDEADGDEDEDEDGESEGWLN